MVRDLFIVEPGRVASDRWSSEQLLRNAARKIARIDEEWEAERGEVRMLLLLLLKVDYWQVLLCSSLIDRLSLRETLANTSRSALALTRGGCCCCCSRARKGCWARLGSSSSHLDAIA